MKMKMGSLQEILWRAKPDPEQLDKQEAVKHKPEVILTAASITAAVTVVIANCYSERFTYD